MKLSVLWLELFEYLITCATWNKCILKWNTWGKPLSLGCDFAVIKIMINFIPSHLNSSHSIHIRVVYTAFHLKLNSNNAVLSVEHPLYTTQFNAITLLLKCFFKVDWLSLRKKLNQNHCQCKMKWFFVLIS